MSTREAVRCRKGDSSRHLLGSLSMKNILEDGVDGHGTAGADDDRPRISAAAVTEHGQRRHSCSRADYYVRSELGDRLHEAVHRRIVDLVHDVEDHHVVPIRFPFYDLLRL